MSEERIAELRAQIAAANDFPRPSPETWPQVRAEWLTRVEQLNAELGAEVLATYPLDRIDDNGGVQYRGSIDGLDVWAWTQPEFRDWREDGDDGWKLAYGWAVYLNDKQYMRSEKGEHETPDAAVHAVLAAIPEAIEIYRHSERVEGES